MMPENFQHETVLLQESIDGIVTDPDGIYVDCTLGGGGHSAAILERLSPQGTLVGFDRDPAALIAATAKLVRFSSQVRLVPGNFAEIDTLLTRLGIGQVNGVLFDLGVSSHQLDLPQRGFSYMKEGPLDMRMDPAQPLSALQVVNEYSEDELNRVIFEYGEERWARRIAKFIVEARQAKPLQNTAELVEVITAAIPAAARRQGPHPAKRTFQALRIAVNGELDGLEQGLRKAVACLKPGGRIAVITFHSLEDRIVKQFINSKINPCICPPDFPECTCGLTSTLKKITKKPLFPSENEINNNPRARSAKLRIAERV